MMIDPSAKLLAVLDHAEEYRGLAMRAKDRGERKATECAEEHRVPPEDHSRSLSTKSVRMSIGARLIRT